MQTLNLTIKNGNPAETRVLEYLIENASDALAAKINSGTKTLTQALAYCKGLALKEAMNGVACIEDAKVFGWCVHYFEEEDAAKTDATVTGGNDTDNDTEADEDDEGEGDDHNTPAPFTPKAKKQASAQAELDLFGGDSDE